MLTSEGKLALSHVRDVSFFERSLSRTFVTLMANVLKENIIDQLELRQKGLVSLCRMSNVAIKMEYSRRFLNESNENHRNIEARTTSVRVEHLCDSQ